MIVQILVWLAVLGAGLPALWQWQRRERGRWRAEVLHYRQQLEDAALCHLRLDGTLRLREWNPALVRLSGREREAVLGQEFFQCCIFPEDIAWLGAELGARGADGAVFCLEFPLRGLGNERKVLAWRLRYRQDEDGLRTLDAYGHDITTLRESVARSQASEARLRQVFQSAPMAMALAEPDGRLLEVNQEYARFMGQASALALSGHSLLDQALPEDAGDLQAALQAAGRGGRYRLEARFVTRRGELRWGDARGLMLEDSRGQAYLVSQIADVHERKQAELELTEHRNQLLVAQRIARLGAWRWQFGSRRVELSDVFLEMIDCPPGTGSLELSTVEALVLPDDAIRVRGLLQALETHEQQLVTEVRARTFRGAWRYWRVDITVERNAAGQRWRLVGTAQDITEARLAEVALRQSETRYRSLFDTNLDGLYFVTLDGMLDECNPAFFALTGYSNEEVRGMSSRALTPPDWVAADDLAGNQIRSRGYCDIIRKELLHRDGHRIPVAFRAWHIRNEHGEPIRVLGMVRDITELQKAEAEREALQKGLQQAQKMEAIGQLAGGIAHDFNNILASILGYNELAASRPAAVADTSLQRQLQEVQLAGERGRELIQQLLLFSRGGSRHGERQAVRGLVEDSVRLLQPSLPASLQLRCRIHEPLPEVVMERVAMQQVLMNLVINARDAMAARGEVQLLVGLGSGGGRCASCHREISGRHVEIAVCDQGPGIAAEIAERIFDPFFSTKAPGQGSGMGLSVVHGIVHEFGGHILLESSPMGSQFRLLLPAASVPEPVQAPAAGQGRHVLVVDDEPMVAALLAEVLRGQGYRVTECHGSLSALDCLRAERVDLLLTDLLMPELTGVELIEHARQQQPHLPVLLMSGQPALLESTGLPALAKPVDMGRLLALVGALLDVVEEEA